MPGKCKCADKLRLALGLLVVLLTLSPPPGDAIAAAAAADTTALPMIEGQVPDGEPVLPAGTAAIGAESRNTVSSKMGTNGSGTTGGADFVLADLEEEELVLVVEAERGEDDAFGGAIREVADGDDDDDDADADAAADAVAS